MTQVSCWLCQQKVDQLHDGTGGHEFGISKWFQTIEPWPVQLIICNLCFKKLSKFLKLTDYEIEAIQKDMPKEK